MACDAVTGRLTLVGVGPGDPELMTLKAKRVIAEADVVAYLQTATSQLAADTAAALLGHARHLAFAVPMTGDGAAEAAYDDAARAIDAAVHRGEAVALLCEGDPMLYGSAASILQRLAHIGATVVPGITAASAAAAITGMSLARGTAPLTIVPATAGPAALRRALGARGGVVIYKLGRHVAEVKRAAAGAARKGTVVVHATRPDEAVMALSEAPDTLPYFSACLFPPVTVTRTLSDEVAIVALTASALPVARRVSRALAGAGRPATIHGPPELDVDAAVSHVPTAIARLFCHGRAIVGLCATGILVRAVADSLEGKEDEPPVVAVAEDGSAVVPLLNAHRGGNAIARIAADALGVATTVTALSDVAIGVALDDPPPGWSVADARPFKALARAIADGEGINAPDVPFLSGLARGARRVEATVARVSDGETPTYIPRTVALGMGASRGADPVRALAAARAALVASDIDERAVALVASLDLKADEAALHSVADALSVPFRVFDADTLRAEEARLETPSDVVREAVGVAGVAEAAALSAAGPAGQLIAAKRVCGDVTVALAMAPEPIRPDVGRARGTLFVVGIGPGPREWRTAECLRALAVADDLVGYSLYLDLVDDLRGPDQRRHDYRLGEESERVRAALTLAGAGRTVALVSSGDPGIYAMASLAAEMLDDHELPDSARRIDLRVVPGVSAAQAAAARVGAPLGHDFAFISLSDLMTPWTAIRQRLKAAATADFAVALYNPRSARRTHQLVDALAILKAARPARTPVIVADNVGRPGEAVAVTTLEALDPERVGMLSTVIIGASTTRTFKRGDGSDVVYTPRGYTV